jgi:hypothetical protein
MKHLLLAGLCVIGCSKKDENAPAPAPTPATKAPIAAPEPPAQPPAQPPAPKAVDVSHGECHVVAKGAISMLNVFQWHTPEMRQKMGYKNEGMILNCLGKLVQVNLLTPDKPFPTKPGTYKIGKGGDISLMGSIRPPGAKSASIWKPEGTVEITAFDDKHIAGKVTAKAETLPKSTDLELEITFDMQCYNLSGCVGK